jgi:putative oxidoreductase
MLVAYATAHPDELKAILSDTNRFLKAPPFLVLLTAIIVLAFGPGAFSLDGLLGRWFRESDE